jgi:hypothetical protein
MYPIAGADPKFRLIGLSSASGVIARETRSLGAAPLDTKNMQPETETSTDVAAPAQSVKERHQKFRLLA